jgi:GlpG protein
LLILLSVLATVLFLSKNHEEFVASHLFIRETFPVGDRLGWYVTPSLLPEVERGEVWRLITPIFPHVGGPGHLLLNALAIIVLGAQVERLLGPLRYALLVLFLAAGSNLAQYLFSEVTFQDWSIVVTRRSPAFGGLSGVVFGLFGYTWMKLVYERNCGLILTRNQITFSIIWLFLCFTGWLGPIANTAHIAGLMLGMLCGYLSAALNGWGLRE